MIYQKTLKGISSNMLEGFFGDWPNPPSPYTHLKLLQNSNKIILAIDDDWRHVAGFVTAVSDGVLSASIPFLEVLPEYRDQGIGKELLTMMLDELKGIYRIDVLCGSPSQLYCEELGLSPSQGATLLDQDGQSGMHYPAF